MAITEIKIEFGPIQNVPFKTITHIVCVRYCPFSITTGHSINIICSINTMDTTITVTIALSALLALAASLSAQLPLLHSNNRVYAYSSSVESAMLLRILNNFREHFDYVMGR